MVSQGLQELLEILEATDQLDHKEAEELLVLTVSPEVLEKMDNPGSKDHLDQLD